MRNDDKNQETDGAVGVTYGGHGCLATASNNGSTQTRIAFARRLAKTYFSIAAVAGLMMVLGFSWSKARSGDKEPSQVRFQLIYGTQVTSALYL